jgi:hypothetical protein
MNKRKFKTILNLYRDGASRTLCVQNILALSKTYFEASIWIEKFYDKLYGDQLEYSRKYTYNEEE